MSWKFDIKPKPEPEPEPGVVCIEEDKSSQHRVDSAIRCLPHYDPSSDLNLTPSFHYWKIRDYAYSYRSNITTPSIVCHFPLLFLCFFKIYKSIYIYNTHPFYRLQNMWSLQYKNSATKNLQYLYWFLLMPWM